MRISNIAYLNIISSYVILFPLNSPLISFPLSVSSHFLIPLISSSFSLCSHFLFKPIVPSDPFPLLLFPCFISFQFFFPSSHLTTSPVSLPCSSCLPSSFSSCLLPYPLLLLLLLHSSFHFCPVLSPLLFFPCFLLSPLILPSNPICPWSHAALQMGSCVSPAAIGYRLL